MRDSIIVSASELRSLIQDVRRTGKTYVEVTISDSFEDDGETYQPLHGVLSLVNDISINRNPHFGIEI